MTPAEPETSVREARRPRPNPPIATLVSMLALVAVQLMAGPGAQGFGAVHGEALRGDGWFRLVTAVLLHATWAHLGWNLLLHGLVGTILERRLGSARFLVILLGSGVVGALGSALASGLLGRGPSIGASGAIYGLLGAWMVLGGRTHSGRPTSPRLPAVLWLLLAVILVRDNIRPEIDWAAHAFGAAAGLAAGMRIRVSSSPAKRVAPTPWVPRLASLLVGIYAVGAVWGSFLYRTGQFDSLPEGPYKWLVVNNVAWEVATSGTTPPRLARLRDQMTDVVESEPNQSAYADTLATLHHLLGEHDAALELERDVSWREERPDYVKQFARFAWAAAQASEESLSPYQLVARSAGDGLLVLEARRGGASVQGIELDALYLRDGLPRGLLRLVIPPDPARELRLPAWLLGESDESGAIPDFVVVEAAPAGTRSSSAEGVARYWRLDPGVFDPSWHPE